MSGRVPRKRLISDHTDADTGGRRVRPRLDKSPHGNLHTSSAPAPTATRTPCGGVFGGHFTDFTADELNWPLSHMDRPPFVGPQAVATVRAAGCAIASATRAADRLVALPNKPPPATPGEDPLSFSGNWRLAPFINGDGTVNPFFNADGTPFVFGLNDPPRGPAITITPDVTRPPTSEQLVPGTPAGNPPASPSQARWPIGMFKPGWHVGAYFRCHNRRGLHHRVYEGPPEGTPRVRLGPEEITIDFTKAYRIKALFCNETFSAVQFKVLKTSRNGSVSHMKVWTNVRRGGDRWADIVHPSMGDTDQATTDEHGRIGEAIIITPRLRSVSSHRFAPSAPSNPVD